MAIKVVECLDWEVENKVGELLRFAEAFAADGVDLDAFWAYVSHAGGPTLAAIAKKPARLAASLRRLGVAPVSSRCLRLTGRDKAGVLVPACRALAAAGINIERADAMGGGGCCSAVLRVCAADLPKARKILKAR